MKTPLQHLDSNAFCELRLAAGISTDQLASDLGISKNTVRQWNRSDAHPRWKYIRILSERFKLDPSKLVELLWNETVGDPCPCGCGGDKVLPDYDEARQLYVKTICVKCGKSRIHRGRTQGHFKLCRQCSYNSRSHGTVELTCVGYKPFGARAPSFAKSCLPPHRVEKKRKTLRYYGRTDDDGQHAFIDESAGLYRCKGCAGAISLISKLERDIKKFWALARPYQNPPRIRNLDQLRKARIECGQLSFKDGSGAVVIFDRHSFKLGHKNLKPARPRENSVSQSKGLLVKFARLGRADVVKGLCRFCSRLVFSSHRGRAPKVHAKCYQSHWSNQFRRGLPADFSKRGRPIDLKTLRKHYTWAIRHKLAGETLGDIASEFGIQRNAVVEGIASTIDHLPELHFVPKGFRQRIFLLHAST